MYQQNNQSAWKKFGWFCSGRAKEIRFAWSMNYAQLWCSHFIRFPINTDTYWWLQIRFLLRLFYNRRNIIYIAHANNERIELQSALSIVGCCLRCQFVRYLNLPAMFPMGENKLNWIVHPTRIFVYLIRNQSSFIWTT